MFRGDLLACAAWSCALMWAGQPNQLCAACADEAQRARHLCHQRCDVHGCQSGLWRRVDCDCCCHGGCDGEQTQRWLLAVLLETLAWRRVWRLHQHWLKPGRGRKAWSP